MIDENNLQYCVTDLKKFWIVTTKAALSRLVGCSISTIDRNQGTFSVNGFIIGTPELIKAKKGFALKKP